MTPGSEALYAETERAAEARKRWSGTECGSHGAGRARVLDTRDHGLVKKEKKTRYGPDPKAWCSGEGQVLAACRRSPWALTPREGVGLVS